MVHKCGLAISVVVIKEMHIVKVGGKCREYTGRDGRMQMLRLLAAQQLYQLRQLGGHLRRYVAN